MNASWAILHHPKQIHVGRTPLTFTMDAQSMVVPSVSPFSGVGVDRWKEEVVD
jgi:hypothetical protein